MNAITMSAQHHSFLVDLPYFAQWESRHLVGDILAGRIRARDDPRWAKSGARTPEEYEFWSWRACGIACLRMILAGTRGETPSMIELARDLMGIGAFVRQTEGVKGLIYEPFARYLARQFHLRAMPIPQLSIDSALGSLRQGNLVFLASVSAMIRDSDSRPRARGGHLVLVLGVYSGDVVLHNPSGKDVKSQSFARVPMRRFQECFAGKGVAVALPERRLDSGGARILSPLPPFEFPEYSVNGRVTTRMNNVSALGLPRSER